MILKTTSATVHPRISYLILTVLMSCIFSIVKISTALTTGYLQNSVKTIKRAGLTSNSLQLKKESFSFGLAHKTLSTLSSTETDLTESNTIMTSNFPKEMSEDERYLFDLNGFIVIRNVLTPEEIKEANDVIDRHQEQMIERKESALRNAVKGTNFYGSGPGRKDLGGVLEWGKDSKVFQKILAHPRLVPLFHGILGKG